MSIPVTCVVFHEDGSWTETFAGYSFTRPAGEALPPFYVDEATGRMVGEDAYNAEVEAMLRDWPIFEPPAIPPQGGQ